MHLQSLSTSSKRERGHYICHAPFWSQSTHRHLLRCGRWETSSSLLKDIVCLFSFWMSLIFWPSVKIISLLGSTFFVSRFHNLYPDSFIVWDSKINIWCRLIIKFGPLIFWYMGKKLDNQGPHACNLCFYLIRHILESPCPKHAQERLIRLIIVRTVSPIMSLAALHMITYLASFHRLSLWIHCVVLFLGLPVYACSHVLCSSSQTDPNCLHYRSKPLGVVASCSDLLLYKIVESNQTRFPCC